MRAAGTPGSMSPRPSAASSRLFRPPERVWRHARIAVASAAPMPVALAYRRHLGWGVTLAARRVRDCVYVFIFADRPAHSDPTTFFSTLLDAITQGALYFVVASGFTLVFGLMRVVNMAHGSLYLVAAYVAIDVQRRIITGNPDTTVSSSQVSMINWFVRAARGRRRRRPPRARACSSCFLRWNQGQDLRQALITIALSVIVADQVIVHTGGGLAEDMSFPGRVNQFVDLHVRGFSYSGSAALHPRPRARHRPRALAVAEAHPHRDGHPRGSGRPRDGRGARRQHPAHVHDRVLRRLGRSQAWAR